jgi:hypothetical protein
MLSGMFAKPLNSLTAVDIERLHLDQVRESDVVEFKQALSGKGGPDAWHTGEGKVSDIARDKIVNELVAFANAHGGTLVLGVAETNDKPPRADRICPIPRCADLAERLSRALAETVEPPFAPFPAIVPVATDGDAGVVIFQVAASRNAPHRHRSSREAYIRRGEQAVPMTMREIQDLTLQVERGIASLEAKFEKAAHQFAEMQRLSTGVALRATAVPLAPISVPVPQSSTFIPPRRRFAGTLGRQKLELVLPQEFGRIRPILRGIRATGRDATSESTIEIRETGLIEIHYLRVHEPDRYLYVGWFLGLACSALCALDEVRKQAAAPGTDYALELEVRNHMGSVATYGGSENGSWKTDTVPVVFPRYQVSSPDKFRVLVQLIERDFWNAIGQERIGPEIEVEI